jgi:hypothetical protein
MAMTPELDERLRAALHAVPREAPPASLSTAALARARRSRRRAVTGLVALVAVLAAAAVTVPAVVLRHAAAPQTANQPTQPTQPITGFMVTGYTTVADPYHGKIPKVASGPVVRYPPTVYSPSQHRYVTPPWRIALPSPDGRLFAVSNAGRPPGSGDDAAATEQVGFVPADRIGDTTAVRWVAGVDTTGYITWTADSRHLVVLDFPTRPGTFQLVDAQTLATRSLNLAVDQDESFSLGLPVVPPEGRGFAMNWSALTGSGVTRWRLQYYDDRGQRTRHVLIVGTGDLPTQVAQPFSPDARLVAMSEGDSTDIVDTSSGRIVRHGVDGLFVGWYDEEHFLVSGGVSSARRLVRLVELRTGRTVVQKVVAPFGRMLTAAWVAPVRGTPPPGAVVL